eukprot:s957_g2.t1
MSGHGEEGSVSEGVHRSNQELPECQAHPRPGGALLVISSPRLGRREGACFKLPSTSLPKGVSTSADG